MWDTSNLLNESDVEQKFLYPLLTQARPNGLSLPSEVVQTKVNIRRLPIGKGVEQKLYFPDYLIVNHGLPLIVVEAKHPNESIEEGYRQARMYAAQLNALFAHGVSPVKFVIASNGVELWFGYSDHVEPIRKDACAGLGLYSPAISELQDLMGWDKISAYSREVALTQKPHALFKPRKLLGGADFQREEVPSNSFGLTVTTSVAHIFNPETTKDRANIVTNAYVPSHRRERYIDPIDRIIRAAKPPSVVHATRFEDTSEPKEVIAKLRAPRELEHKVLLLVGSVGAGKSTFVDYLQEVALPKDIAQATVWCRINMNLAPVTAVEIYRWLREQLIQSCRDSLPTVDFDDLDTLSKLYGVEISRFTKGVGKLYEADVGTYNIKLAEFIQGLQADHQLTANAHVRYACGERHKLCLIVLDNCDKKTRDEQLLMFEAAQWLQKEFRCLVILPMRDETYDNHREEPPLDTVLKDMVFRIEPPLFQHVLMRRVQLALKDLSSGGGEKLHFGLPNGFQVEYPRSDQAFFLTSILKSLFEHDRFARRMIVGLAGRNMRKAMEIFIEFCKSGYIGEDQIFKIRQSEGNYALPLDQVATVLLRMNRRFYDSDHSYLKNIFSASQDDALPAFFSRYMILRWLRNRSKASGTSGLEGYYPKREIKHSLLPYGLSPELMDREFNYLLSGHCIVAEHLRTDAVEDDDLVRLGPAGFVHLDMVGNIHYLAAVAEDTFFDDRLQAERVTGRIKSADSQRHAHTSALNADELVSYLERVREKIAPENGKFFQSAVVEDLAAFSEARDAVERVKKSQASADPWFDADRRLPRKSVHRTLVVNSVPAVGCFMQFDNGLVGLVHRSKISGRGPAPGDMVDVEIQWVDVIQKKMGLTLVRVAHEDAGDQIEGAHTGGA
jgi:hypothetical protein